MSEFLTDHGVVVALVCAGVAIVYGALTARSLLALSPGNEQMRAISNAVQEGARAYLNRQYIVIAGIGLVIAIVILFFLGWQTAGAERVVEGGHRVPLRDRRASGDEQPHAHGADRRHHSADSNHVLTIS